jgi:hypothetical protein
LSLWILQLLIDNFFYKIITIFYWTGLFKELFVRVHSIFSVLMLSTLSKTLLGLFHVEVVEIFIKSRNCVIINFSLLIFYIHFKKYFWKYDLLIILDDIIGTSFISKKDYPFQTLSSLHWYHDFIIFFFFVSYCVSYFPQNLYITIVSLRWIIKIFILDNHLGLHLRIYLFKIFFKHYLYHL